MDFGQRLVQLHGVVRRAFWMVALAWAGAVAPARAQERAPLRVVAIQVVRCADRGDPLPGLLAQLEIELRAAGLEVAPAVDDVEDAARVVVLPPPCHRRVGVLVRVRRALDERTHEYRLDPPAPSTEGGTRLLALGIVERLRAAWRLFAEPEEEPPDPGSEIARMDERLARFDAARAQAEERADREHARLTETQRDLAALRDRVEAEERERVAAAQRYARARPWELDLGFAVRTFATSGVAVFGVSTSLRLGLLDGLRLAFGLAYLTGESDDPLGTVEWHLARGDAAVEGYARAGPIVASVGAWLGGGAQWAIGEAIDPARVDASDLVAGGLSLGARAGLDARLSTEWCLRAELDAGIAVAGMTARADDRRIRLVGAQLGVRVAVAYDGE